MEDAGAMLSCRQHTEPQEIVEMGMESGRTNWDTTTETETNPGVQLNADVSCESIALFRAEYQRWQQQMNPKSIVKDRKEAIST